MSDGAARSEGGADDAGVRGLDVVPYDSSTFVPDVIPSRDGEVVCSRVEICGNGLDDNCSGEADEGCACEPGMTQPCYPGNPAEAGRGVCTLGSQRCEGSGEIGVWGACTGAGHPMGVVCGGGMDYLCDGVIDEGCPCDAGSMRACYTGRRETRSVGTCRDGVQRCVANGASATWGPCQGEVLPSAPACDGVDHLCNGMPNAGCVCTPGATRSCYDGPAGTAGVGLCHSGTQSCAMNAMGGSAWGTCTGQVLPSGAVCDGTDHACNGMPYVACDCTPGATRPCYDGPSETAGVGQCHGGTQTCAVKGGIPAWGACAGEVLPTANTCDGVDRMCNGMPISGACSCMLGAMQPCYDGPAGTVGVGQCRAGVQSCEADPGGGGSVWGACVGEVVPELNTCDGVDRLCDGNPLAGDCNCVLGNTRPCYDGPAGTQDVGLCHAGAQTCIASADGTGSLWTRCTGEIVPAATRCDGVDRMCNSRPFQGCVCTPGATQACYDGPAATRGRGICRDGTQTCALVGGVAAWNPCTDETLPSAETCGNRTDDNCNGTVDEGCTTSVVCPGDMTISAGTPVALTATPSAGGRAVTYAWSLSSAPPGGSGTPSQWSPSTQTAMTETFLANIPGNYTVHVTVTDTNGVTAGCDTHLQALGHGLRIQMSWDGTGDMDLHVHNGTTSTAWNTANDCYYGNCRSSTTPILSWDAAGTTDDPVLDVDNTSGYGPETTRIDAPVVGETYTIGAYNYGSATGRVVTINVFCGGVSSPTQTFVSTPMVGGGSGGCSAGNGFWRVAAVTFTSSSSCTITPIDAYTTGAASCAAF